MIAGGQRSRLKSQIFNPPFLSKVWQNIINIEQQKRVVEDPLLELRSLTPRDHSFLPSYPPKLLNPSFADQKYPQKKSPFLVLRTGMHYLERWLFVTLYIIVFGPPVPILYTETSLYKRIATGGETRLVYSVYDIQHPI